MIDIKPHPIDVMEAITSLLKIQSKYISRVQDDKNDILKYVDNLPGIRFYFAITGYENSKPTGRRVILVAQHPKSRLISEEGDFRISDKDLVTHFKRWISYVEKYHELSNVMIDGIDEFADEFFEEIKPDEEDTYLSTDDQIKVDFLLEAIDTKLLALNEGKDDPVVEGIRNDVNELRDSQGNYTKKVLAKKVASILAKMKKASIRLLRGFWDEGKKQVYKRVINGGFDEVGGLIETIKDVM